MRRTHVLALASSFFLCTTSLAQNPRAPASVDNLPGGGGGNLATAGDVTAVVYSDAGARELFVSTSDGRALEWSAPVRLDIESGLTDYLSTDPIAIVDDRVYVAYADDRFGERELFVRVYNATSGTLGPEVRIPNGYLPGEASTFSWDIEAEAGPGADRVYLVIAVDQPSPQIERARVVASHDGGASFPIEYELSSADVDAAYSLEVADGVVHVAWSDNRNVSNGNDVFYQRSTDGALTFLPNDVLLDASGPGIGDVNGIGFHLFTAPPFVVVGWAEVLGSEIEIHATISADNGLTFGPDKRVDQAPPGALIGFMTVAEVADPDAGSVAVGWTDTRFGGLGATELFAATTFDGGGSWSEAQLSSGGILGVSPDRGSVHEADGQTWMSFGYSGYFTGEVFSALSLDGGATWEPPLAIEATPTAGAATFGLGATNLLYGNRIHMWLEGSLFGAVDVQLGGYRVPTLDYVETLVPPGAHFELSGFGEVPFGAVLLSGSTGSLPVGFGDPRDLGLAPDPVFFVSLGEAFGALGASLVGGAGVTPTIPPLTPGLGLHAAALSFDLAGGVTVVEISDVQILP
ncbi:MAG: sialidase family protein [Planctomycetota bacterium]